MSKDHKDQDDLLKEIKELDPTFNPQSNVVRIRPTPDISNIIPLLFSDLKKETPPPLEFVFTPCLPTQGIAFIYAATGLGKTLFTLNLAYAIAGGGNFLKYSCPKPRTVLYVDGEMPYNQLHTRVMQIAHSQGDLDFKDNLKFLTPDKLLPFRIPMIDDSFGQEIYTKILERDNIEVVIFDNLSMLTSLDENKSNEWKVVQDWLLYLRSLGKTVIVVHHSGKDKNGYRGTSRMLDCSDTAISLQPILEEGLEESSFNGKKFKIVYHKARVFGGKDSMSYEVTLENNFWAYQSIEMSILDQVIDRLNAGMSQREIAKELFISQPTVNRLIKKARLTGRVISEK